MKKRPPKLSKKFLAIAESLHDFNPILLSGYKHKGHGFLFKTLNSIFMEHDIDVKVVQIKPLSMMTYFENDRKGKSIDITSNDIFQHEIRMVAQGVEFSIYPQLPVPSGSTLTISGTEKRIVWAIAPQVIKVESGGTIILNMSKQVVTIQSVKETVLVDMIPHTVSVLVSKNFYSTQPLKIPLILYALYTNGWHSTLHPALKFVSSEERVPNGYSRYEMGPVNEEDLHTCIIIPLAVLTPQLHQAILSVTYVLKLRTETASMFDTITEETEQEVWFQLICQISSGGRPVSYNQEDISKHLGKLESFNEKAVFDALSHTGVVVDNFSALFAYMVSDIERIVKEEKSNTSPQRLGLEEFLYAPILNKMTGICSIIKRKTNPSNQYIMQLIRTKLNEGAMFSLTSGSNCLIPQETNNLLSKIFQGLSQNSTGELPMEALIPTGADTQAVTLNIIPVTNPKPTTLNPYLKWKDRIEIGPDMKALMKHLETGE